MLEKALEYVRRGWAVFPLVPKGKRPLTATGFKEASKDEAQIRAWWGKWPDANIGIATGAISNLVVLDFDQKSGGLDTLGEIADELPRTLRVYTGGGGEHWYYLADNSAIRSRAGLKPGLDVRAEGGYVVGAGSVTDGEYVMMNGLAVAEMNAYIHELVREAPRSQGTSGASLPEGEKGSLAKATLKFILEGAPSGLWHQEFYKAAMDLKQQGYSFDEAAAKLESAGLVLDENHDWPQLEDVYANRSPRHPPRYEDTLQVAEGRAERSEASVSLVVKASSLIQDMTSYLADKDKVKGEPTGVAGLDRLLGGGKRLGEVTCWHAEAKTGKNTLWHKLMHLWLNRGIAIGYASRELTPETEVLPNLLSLEFQTNVWLAEPNPAYTEPLTRWPLYFASGYGLFELDDIRRWVGELQAVGVHYFWFDHLHYMLEDPEDHKTASKLVKELKTLAKIANIHMDLIIQPNKLQDGQRLSLGSIKGGSAMGQAIDNLLILERYKQTDVKNVAKLTMEVCRSKLAKPGSMFLQYDPLTTDFLEVEKYDVDDGATPQPATPYNGRQWEKVT